MQVIPSGSAQANQPILHQQHNQGMFSESKKGETNRHGGIPNFVRAASEYRNNLGSGVANRQPFNIP